MPALSHHKGKETAPDSSSPNSWERQAASSPKNEGINPTGAPFLRELCRRGAEPGMAGGAAGVCSQLRARNLLPQMGKHPLEKGPGKPSPETSPG